MPKAQLPLNGLFAINKPSGQVCMTMLNRLQPLFSTSKLFEGATNTHKGRRRGKTRKPTVKMGQGGTLDPLADGVLGESFPARRTKDPKWKFIFQVCSYRPGNRDKAATKVS
jgi:tRNA U55 pseudouridine synthase TruB